MEHSDFDGLKGAGPLLALAVIILAGVLAGRIARAARLPRITGQIER